jgi:putative transposase
MPSTHLSLHYHLIFSTKDRVAHMHKDWRGRLHAYMGGIVNDLYERHTKIWIGGTTA